jgi:hypothetical protein
MAGPKIAQDLRIDYPLEEELVGACEFALEWFEDWAKHADDDHDFGGEYRVMQRLRLAIREVGLRDEL